MPCRDYVSIIFSHSLAQAPKDQKVQALHELYRYLVHHGIAVGDTDVNLGEIAEDLFHPRLDLTGHFQSGVLAGSLTKSEQADIAALGFVFWRLEKQLYVI